MPKRRNPHICIIGAGSIGSRHLQGLARIRRDIEITVIDSSSDAIDLAKRRVNEIPTNSCIKSLRFINSVKHLKNDLTLVIIATNADVRRNVIDILLNSVEIKYLILEKIAFQSINDFEAIISKLNDRKINTWVNCPRRVFPFFKKLRKEAINAQSLAVSVKGSNWGLASNSIHMFDLLAYLTNQTDIIINKVRLDFNIYESKRKKFIEFGGKIIARNKFGHAIELVDDRMKKLPLIMKIKLNGKLIIIEQENEIVRIQSKYSKKTSKKPFHVPLQSELTGDQVDIILKTGSSELTPLEESFLLHKPLLNVFNHHLSIVLNKPITVCPIT